MGNKRDSSAEVEEHKCRVFFDPKVVSSRCNVIVRTRPGVERNDVVDTIASYDETVFGIVCPLGHWFRDGAIHDCSDGLSMRIFVSPSGRVESGALFALVAVSLSFEPL